MLFHFFKYQGTGNDFVILDGMKTRVRLNEEQISHLCDRRFGVGADGLIEIFPSQECDFEMSYYNADGRLGSMCANGGRCITAYAHRKGYCGEKTTFLAFDGLHESLVLTPEKVRLQLKDAPLPIKKKRGLFTNTGSPHLVIFRSRIDNINVVSEGRKIRYSKAFAPDGTNVNFVQIIAPGIIRVRTYERGVENETLSCGTGVVASAICSAYSCQDEKNTYTVSTLGGELSVSFKMTDTERITELWIEGPATFVFEGEINL
jgi:diaminopimelate epimerase